MPVLLGIAALVVVALLSTSQVRARAEGALGRGMPPREGELARGFVLGEDDEIDERTVEDFRRSGLSHLLAVSGQNVMLLALLASPILAAFGIPLRTRLVWLLGLIAVYVPLAGAGPSIQRAGVMGALGVLATLAGRRASRFYALVVAAVVTLAVDPGIAADVGWQLSFAAVVGILLLAAPLREAISGRAGSSSGWRHTLAEGAAVTIAATLATAPLIAFHFEAISTTTLAANLLALPAVAPAMWLGMLVAAAGQVPALPVEPLNWLNALLLAYIAQVAAWCGRPSWAYLDVRLSFAGLVASYATIAATAVLSLRLIRHRRIASLRRNSTRSPPRCNANDRRWLSNALHHRFGPRMGAVVGVVVAALAMVGLAWVSGRDGAGAAEPVRGLRVSVLDVGQGDAILIQPAGAPAVLVDGGPPGDDLAHKLRAAGVGSLGAAIVTHDQSDHAGGIEELFGAMPVGRLVFGRLSRSFLADARSAGATPVRVAAGAVVRDRGLQLKILWPPREALAEPLGGVDPNSQALVILARWRHFSMLLTADAEAEAVPIDSGPVDVLKVAHHGSDDAGLASLLDRATPRLAVISVGADNTYGHPTPRTLATLSTHGVPTMRTDLHGSVVFEVNRRGFGVEGASPGRAHTQSSPAN